jgi:hypothetical protein
MPSVHRSGTGLTRRLRAHDFLPRLEINSWAAQLAEVHACWMHTMVIGPVIAGMFLVQRVPMTGQCAVDSVQI